MNSAITVSELYCRSLTYHLSDLDTDVDNTHGLGLDLGKNEYDTKGCITEYPQCIAEAAPVQDCYPIIYYFKVSCGARKLPGL